MGIGKDINQRVFRNEYQKALVNFIYTCNWLMEQMKSILAKESLTLQQFNILRILRGADAPLSTLQIRQRMLDKMSDTSRIVDRLIAKQLVEKRICAEDKRLVDVWITAQGKEVLERVDLLQNEMDALLNTLSEEEAATLNTIFDKIRHSGEQ